MLPQWDERYGGDEFFYGTEPNDFLRQQVAKIPAGARVLCLAEGEGRNAVFLAKQGFAVTAVDGSRVGLEKMARLARSQGVQVQAVVADLANYVIEPGAWDAIVSIWCHLPPALRMRVHAQVVTGLKPGGVLILEAYRPKQLEYKTGGPPVAEMMMTQAGLQDELAGLEFKILHEIDRQVQEGRGHGGLSAVVQVLALKRR